MGMKITMSRSTSHIQAKNGLAIFGVSQGVTLKPQRLSFGILVSIKLPIWGDSTIWQFLFNSAWSLGCEKKMTPCILGSLSMGTCLRIPSVLDIFSPRKNPIEKQLNIKISQLLQSDPNWFTDSPNLSSRFSAPKSQNLWVLSRGHNLKNLVRCCVSLRRWIGCCKWTSPRCGPWVFAGHREARGLFLFQMMEVIHHTHDAKDMFFIFHAGCLFSGFLKHSNENCVLFARMYFKRKGYTVFFPASHIRNQKKSRFSI